MNQRDSLFFYFLRMGLWEAEEVYDGAAPGREDWERMFRTAQLQAVTGVVMDGIARTGMRPDRSLWEQWVWHLLYVEQMNRRIVQCGERWLSWLGEKGIRAFVFKGTSVASWYGQPLHRSFGDVDIVVQQGWEKLVPALKEAGIAYRNEHGDLVVQDDDQVPVELHKRWEYVYNPLVNRRLKKLLGKATEKDRELYLVCLILHLQRHFLTYGIGLKQVCDVAVMLHAASLDRERTASLLRRLHAVAFSRLLFGFIDVYLGGTERYPLPPVTSGKRFDVLCDVIMNDGYHRKGQQEALASRSRWAAVRIARNVWFWARRSLRLFSILPGETCGFWWYMGWRRILSFSL